MKTLVNKFNPQVKITAPEIKEHQGADGIYYTIPSFAPYFWKAYWTLVEEGMLPGFEDEEPTEGLGITETCVPPIIVETLNRFGWKVEKGYVEEEPERREEDMILGLPLKMIKRELDPNAEPTEGIKGNLEESPSNVDLAKELQAFLCNYDYEFDDEDPVPSEVAEHFYLLGKQAQEQRPVEWSEEDEAMRDNILRLLSCFVSTSECDSNPSLSTSYLAYQREMDWLKSLKERIKGGSK